MRLIIVGSGVVRASCAYAAVCLGAGVVLVDAAMRGRAAVRQGVTLREGAAGLGATGLTMGPHVGAVAARSAMGLPTDVDLAPLDPLRPPGRPA